MTEQAIDQRRKQIGNVIPVASGECLVPYEVYGFCASCSGPVFLPAAASLISFASFGIGFQRRSLGAINLAAFIDRHGRRIGLLVSPGMMAVGALEPRRTAATALG